ncbi:MAG: GNAT family N-acetyltransferase [Acidiferrobacterales bacterium]
MDDGKLHVAITYLEMRQPPSHQPADVPGTGVVITRVKNPAVSFYRYLYNTVGGQWMWYERRHMDDATLAEIISDPQVEVYVLHVDGVPAGYVELDCRAKGEVEIAYFGLMPDFIGRGLGSHLLDCGLRAAWRKRPQRVWVHTCNLDHPKALAVYRQAGFIPYKTEKVLIDDPRLDGTI